MILKLYSTGSRPSKRWRSLTVLPQVDPKAGESVEGVRILSQIGKYY